MIHPLSFDLSDLSLSLSLLTRYVISSLLRFIRSHLITLSPLWSPLVALSTVKTEGSAKIYTQNALQKKSRKTYEDVI